MLSIRIPQSPKTAKFHTLQSLTKLGSDTSSPINAERKQPFSVFFDEPWSQKFDSPQAKGKSVVSIDPVNRIADLHSKEQIREAIESAATVKDRLQIIDRILAKREELKEMQYQIKLKRSSATIKKLTDIIKTKVKKNQPQQKKEKKKETRKNTLFPPSQSPTLSRSQRSSASRIENVTFVAPPDASKKLLLSPVLKKQSSLVVEDPEGLANERLDSPTLLRSQTQTPSMLLRNSTRSVTVNSPDKEPRLSQVVKQEQIDHQRKNEGMQQKLKRLQTQKSFDLKKTGWSMLLDKILAKPSELVEPPKEENPDWKAKERRMRARTHTYLQAKEKFEEEIYKYLVKHQDDEAYKNIVLETGLPKEQIIRDIETKARHKFGSFTGEKKGSTSPTVNSFRNSIYSSRLVPPLDMQADEIFDRGSPRNHTNYTIATPKKSPIRTQASDDYIGDLDESYASFTEVKLDNLYRQTNVINKAVQDLEKKPENMHINKHRKVAKSYTHKLQDLYQNSEQIMKLTKKKLHV